MVHKRLTVAEIRKRITELKTVAPTDLVRQELYALDRELKAQMLDVNNPPPPQEECDSDFIGADFP